MPPPARPDLKQVAKLFNDTIAAVRDEAPSIEALEPQAIEWVKSARHNIMRQLEAAFYSLERTRDQPLNQPQWALDPAQNLVLTTHQIPTLLSLYTQVMGDNLFALIKDCAFDNCTPHISLYGKQGHISFSINFPAQLAAAPAQAPLRPLVIEDEFSRPVAGQPRIGFGATNFARLLIDARGETSGEADAPSTSKKRRGSRIPNKERDVDDPPSNPAAGKKRCTTRGAVKTEESDDGSRRLRSVTRASSTVTLREPTPGNVRRSGRKAVKHE
ncbi:hypothetical protein C8F04DRAFT_1394590 [Mycena alexandri]|uniref:Uncharacterized protein n=1 Tax=Mycena alexandri TaxID=1745969 RepID=A0AAD6SZ93_9AGAR|nr:hypothetical protein C8F04DRAFT_1394590 [Mycena alexandri]